MFEQTIELEGYIYNSKPFSKKWKYIFKGEETTTGDVVLKKGTSN